MTRTVQSVLIMIAIMLGILLAVPVNQASATQSNSGKGVIHSGVHGQNTRVTAENGKVQIVKGIIYSVRGNRITMDGETFSLPAGKIHDQLGLSVRTDQLYPGLKARLVIRNGSVESVTLLNFFRSKVVTDPQKVKKLRQREMERRGR